MTAKTKARTTTTASAEAGPSATVGMTEWGEGKQIPRATLRNDK